MTQPIHCLSSGTQAIAYLKGEGEYSDRRRIAYPSFIILDLKMTGGDGYSVLEHLKSVPEWAIIPTMVLSASSDPDDIKKAYLLGAGSYLVKPNQFEDLRRLMKAFYDFWIECAVPEVDKVGRWVKTDGRGKLGERFSS